MPPGEQLTNGTCFSNLLRVMSHWRQMQRCGEWGPTCRTAWPPPQAGAWGPRL